MLIGKIFGLFLLSLISIFMTSVVLFRQETAQASTNDLWAYIRDVTIDTVDRPGLSGAPWYMSRCSVEFITIEDTNNITRLKDACVTHKSNFSIAVYDIPYVQGLVALKHQGDINYHPVVHFSTDLIVPAVLSNGDLLARSQTSGYNLLAKIKNLTGSVIPTEEVASDGTTTKYYRLDMINETREEIIVGSEDEYLYSLGVGVSRNDKYAAIWVHDRGPATVNLETMDVHYLSSKNPVIPDGMRVRLAISDNGKTVVAISDDRSLAKIYHIDNTCGSNIYTDIHSKSNCNSFNVFEDPSSALPLNEFLTYDLYFSEDMDSIIMLSYKDKSYGLVRKSTIRPSYSPSISSLHYLALGDSYSSGEGDVDDNGGYYFQGTELPGQCHLSSRSYPFVLRSWRGIDASDMKSVACSGAQVSLDYMHRPATYQGQGNRLAKFSQEEIVREKALALKDTRPGIVPQIEFIKKYRPKVVTLTGTGNDVGFAEVLRYCASNASIGPMPIGDTCSYAQTDSFTQRILEQSINNQYRNMTMLIKEIQGVSPDSKIYIIGYPQFVSANTLCTMNTAFLNKQERQMVRDMTSRLNNVLSRVAADLGVVFVDIEDSLEGGQLCQGSKYVSGLHDLGLQKIHDNHTGEMFHPNAHGHIKMSHGIFQQVPSVEYYIPTSARADSESGDSYMNTQTTHKVRAMDNVIDPGATQKLDLIDVTLQPGSPAIINIFSELTNLGTFEVDSSGKLAAEFTLPNSIRPGYHTLVIEGTSALGDPVTLYQIVMVTSGIHRDMDGDGIPDESDTCNFISVWIDETTGVNVCESFDTQHLPTNSTDFDGTSTSSTELIIADKAQLPQSPHGQSTPASLSIDRVPTREADEAFLYKDGAERYSDYTVRPVRSSLAIWAILTVIGVLLISVKFLTRRTNEKRKRR